VREAVNRAGLAGQIETAQRDLARQPLTAADLARADAVVLDPPHGGAAAQMTAIAMARPERVIYVSCNPATLARDTAVLRQAEYRVQAVTSVDQFLWSARIESVSVFALNTPKRKAAHQY
jgi:23S rRNA (uracil1939-C5)-methyltransferase